MGDVSPETQAAEQELLRNYRFFEYDPENPSRSRNVRDVAMCLVDFLRNLDAPYDSVLDDLSPNLKFNVTMEDVDAVTETNRITIFQNLKYIQHVVTMHGMMSIDNYPCLYDTKAEADLRWDLITNWFHIVLHDYELDEVENFVATNVVPMLQEFDIRLIRKMDEVCGRGTDNEIPRGLMVALAQLNAMDLDSSTISMQTSFHRNELKVDAVRSHVDMVPALFEIVRVIRELSLPNDLMHEIVNKRSGAFTSVTNDHASTIHSWRRCLSDLENQVQDHANLESVRKIHDTVPKLQTTQAIFKKRIVRLLALVKSNRRRIGL